MSNGVFQISHIGIQCPLLNPAPFTGMRDRRSRTRKKIRSISRSIASAALNSMVRFAEWPCSARHTCVRCTAILPARTCCDNFASGASVAGTRRSFGTRSSGLSLRGRCPTTQIRAPLLPHTGGLIGLRHHHSPLRNSASRQVTGTWDIRTTRGACNLLPHVARLPATHDTDSQIFKVGPWCRSRSSTENSKCARRQLSSDRHH
jgi:hypothetical protein